MPSVVLPAADTVTLRAAANASHAVVLSRANILEYWPSLRPMHARFSPANHDRIHGGKHFGSSSHSSCRLTSRLLWRSGGRSISPAAALSRAFTSPLLFSELDREASSTRSSLRCALRLPRALRSSSSRCATARRARWACSSSQTRAVRRPDLRAVSRHGWSSSACIDARRVRGSRTSRSCASGNVRACLRHRLQSDTSLRPASLLSFHVCARPGRATRSSSRVRLNRDRRRFEAVFDSPGRMTA